MMSAETQQKEVLGPTYDPGKPEGPCEWRSKIATREDMIKYLKTAERYWYSDDWYGSERRRDPA